MLGACQSQNVKVQTIGEGMINLNHETGYFKLQDYESDRVKAISTGIADSRFLACAQTGDGTLVLYRAGEEGAETVSLPTVRKYDSQGNMSWEKDFDIPEMDGGSGKLIPMDDGFLLTLSRWPYTQQSEMVYPKHHLIRCDGEGSILWHEALDSYSGEFIQQVFVTDSDEIVTVGCWNYANGEQTADAPSDLVLMRFNENGKCFSRKVSGETILNGSFVRHTLRSLALSWAATASPNQCRVITWLALILILIKCGSMNPLRQTMLAIFH
jgi:hypothetical protein